MRPSRLALFVSCLLLMVLAACALPAASPIPTATRTPPSQPIPTSTAGSAAPTATAQLAGLATATAAPAPPSTVAAQAGFCSDSQVPVLIGNFKSAVLTSNGPLLAALVSPSHGMDARLFRDGRVVNYDAAHAKFLFTSTFAVDWGQAPASGLDTKGSFHELFVPALTDVFSRTYTLVCNQVQVGGVTYHAGWPYPGINYYSAYYPGTAANGNMDWHTWVIGTDYTGSKPYVYAIMQFYWEP